MRTCALRYGLLLLILAAVPALAELKTLELRVAGKNIKSQAVSDGREIYLPLDSLKLLGCSARLNARQDAAQVKFPNGESAEIALARLHGAEMAPFSAIRMKVGAEYSIKDGVCDIRLLADRTVQKPEAIEPAVKKNQPPVETKRIAAVPVQPAPRPTERHPIAPVRPKEKSQPVVSSPKPDEPMPASPRSDQTTERVAVAVNPDQRSAALQPAETLDSAGQQTAEPTSVIPVEPTVSVKPGGLRVKNVTFQTIDATHARLRISTTGRPAITARLLSGPSRLVVDLPNCGIDCEEREWTCDHPFADSMSAIEEKPRSARIVVELQRLVTYRILSADPGGVTINLSAPRGSGEGLNGAIITVDAGHGGPASTGAHAVVNGRTVFEKQLTLSIAKKIARILQEMGANVIMTRTRDEDVGLKTRPTIANDNNADAFVSIHVDDYPNRTAASGSTAYYHMDDESSRALAHSIVERISQVSGLPNRGSRSDRVRFTNGMAVLRYSTMPATLVETAYISNPGDRKKLMSDEWQEKVAKAVCDGIRAYFEGALPEDKLGKG